MSNENTENKGENAGNPIPGAGDSARPAETAAATEVGEGAKAAIKPTIPGLSGTNNAGGNTGGPGSKPPMGGSTSMMGSAFARNGLRLAGRSLKWALIAAIAIPPIGGVVNHGLGVGAINAAIKGYKTEFNAVAGVAGVVAKPFGMALDTMNGTGGGVKAEYVLYCKPNTRVQPMNEAERLRQALDDGYMQGRVDSWLTEPNSRLWESLKSGEYPVIIARFSDPATGQTRHIWIDKHDNKEDQQCPALYQAIPIPLRGMTPGS